MNITGQLFFREADKDAPTHDGRKLMMVVGIVAVPEKCFLQGEHQYVVLGNVEGQLNVLSDTGVDLTEVARGTPAGGLLSQPIWRC